MGAGGPDKAEVAAGAGAPPTEDASRQADSVVVPFPAPAARGGVAPTEPFRAAPSTGSSLPITLPAAEPRSERDDKRWFWTGLAASVVVHAGIAVYLLDKTPFGDRPDPEAIVEVPIQIAEILPEEEGTPPEEEPLPEAESVETLDKVEEQPAAEAQPVESEVGEPVAEDAAAPKAAEPELAEARPQTEDPAEANAVEPELAQAKPVADDPAPLAPVESVTSAAVPMNETETLRPVDGGGLVAMLVPDTVAQGRADPVSGDVRADVVAGVVSDSIATAAPDFVPPVGSDLPVAEAGELATAEDDTGVAEPLTEVVLPQVRDAAVAATEGDEVAAAAVDGDGRQAAAVVLDAPVAAGTAATTASVAGDDAAATSFEQSMDAMHIFAARLREHVLAGGAVPANYEAPTRVSVVRFTLNPDGSVEKVRTVKGSGNSAFDKKARTFVTSIAPFPPIPYELGLEPLVVRVPVRLPR